MDFRRRWTAFNIDRKVWAFLENDLEKNETQKPKPNKKSLLWASSENIKKYK